MLTCAEIVIRKQAMREIPVLTCDNCHDGIYEEDPYWDIHGEILCSRCMIEMKCYAYAGFEED